MNRPAPLMRKAIKVALELNAPFEDSTQFNRHKWYMFVLWLNGNDGAFTQLHKKIRDVIEEYETKNNYSSSSSSSSSSS